MRSRLKVLVLAQYFPPDMGGASTRASNVVKGLLSRENEVIVVAAFPHYPHGKIPRKYKRKAIAPERVGDAKVSRVWIPGLPHSSVATRIILHLCFALSSLFALPWVGKVDVIWAANPNLFSSLPAAIYSWVKRKPVVRNVDDLWPEVFYELGLIKSRLMKMFLDFLAKLSYVMPAAITPISAGYKRKIMQKYGISEEKIHVVEVGVDSVEPFDVTAKRKGRFVAMYSGVLGLGYNFEVVLDAAKLLAKHEEIVFVIRGVGELAPRLQERIRKLDIGNVVLNVGFLPKEELSALMRSADVFLVPMASASVVDDGLPTKIFEYQSYGKPIVCVSSGEPARYVEATGSGLVAKPGNANNLAEVILRIYENRKLAAELGWKGWHYVSENLTLEKIGVRMHKALASV